MTFILGALVLLTIFLFYKEFLVLAFDPTLAVVLRLPVTFLRYLLLVLIAVTIVISLQIVGIALVLAMLVTPAAAAQLLTRRLPLMMATAALIGAVVQRDRPLPQLLSQRGRGTGHGAGGYRSLSSWSSCSPRGVV